jgi:hypothetical protein
MAEYIIEPLDTDSESIFQDFVEYVQSYNPNYQVSEGQLDVIIARFFAIQTSFTADMASRVLRAIFRYFGSTMAGIQPLPGSYASASVSFTIAAPTDTDPEQALVIPAGTYMGIMDIDGDLQIFSLIESITVLASATTTTGVIRAIELGAVSNGLTGAVQMIEQVDWVTSAIIVGATSGGSDPEDDELYLNRLVENLALMAPRPLAAPDFATMAKNVPGVWRASVIENFGGGANEVQRITSDYTGGNFTLSFGGDNTTGIPFDARADEVQAALVTLGSVEPGDVSCAGGPLPVTPIDITFGGKYGYADVPLITATTGTLSGGSSFAITQVTPGAIWNTSTANSIAISAVDVNGEPLAPDTKQDLIDYLASYRTKAQNFIITFLDPGYHTIQVTYAGLTIPGQNADSVRSEVDRALEFYLSPAHYPVSQDISSPRDWPNTPIIRYHELVTVVENVAGWDYTTSLVFGINGGTQTTADKALSGAFPMTRPGTILGAVSEP